MDVDFAPMPVPGQVTDVSATAGRGSATRDAGTRPTEGGPVSDLHGHPLHRLRSAADDHGHGLPPATGTTVTGLANGTDYTFVVQASNANGGGVYSAPSNAVDADRIDAALHPHRA